VVGRPTSGLAANAELDQAVLGCLAVGNAPLAGWAVPARLERGAAGVVAECFVTGLTVDGPASAPVGQQPERTGQVEPVGREGVLHPDRPGGIGDGMDDPLTLESAQAFGQDVRGDTGHAGQEVVEAGRPIEEALDKEQGPAIADPLEGCPERR
jgi:hypothetical protein